MRYVVGWGPLLLALSLSDAYGQVQGPPLVPATPDEMMAVVRVGEGQVTVVNFWAAWCVPCRAALPEYARFGKDFAEQGLRVLFVSTDLEEDVTLAQMFLGEQGITEQTYLLSAEDGVLTRAFHEQWSGALPATFVYDGGGTLLDFWEGQTGYAELHARVVPFLGG